MLTVEEAIGRLVRIYSKEVWGSVPPATKCIKEASDTIERLREEGFTSREIVDRIVLYKNKHVPMADLFTWRERCYHYVLNDIADPELCDKLQQYLGQ